MSDKRQNETPRGAGGETVVAARKAGKPLLTTSAIIHPNASICQAPIPTAAGGPVAWAACDGIFSLVHELLARKLVVDGPDLDAAIIAAWQAMGTAAYLSRKDRKAWPEVNYVEAN